MPRRVLPDFVKQTSKRYRDQITRNLENKTKALKQKKHRKQREQQHNHNININHNNNSNTNNKPSTPINRPNSIIPDTFDILSSDEPSNVQNTTKNTQKHVQVKPKPKKPKTTTKVKPKAKTGKKQTKKKAKKKAKKKKKRRNKNNLMLDTDEDEWSDSSGGSVGSLKDFIINDNSVTYTSPIKHNNNNNNNGIGYGTMFIDSDEDYDVMNDIKQHKNQRKRYRSFDANNNSDDGDEYDDFNDSFDSLMNINAYGSGSYNSMIVSPPPKKKRKGQKTVLKLLPLCRWGPACYRKNSQHFNEFAHPWKDNNHKKSTD